MPTGLNPDLAPIDSSKAQFDNAPLPSIDDVRAPLFSNSTYVERMYPGPAPRGLLVDISIDGTQEERRLASGVSIFSTANVVRKIDTNAVVDSRTWTGTVATSVLRRVILFLFGPGALGGHAPTSAP